ncbi:HNH endonuclease [Streptomyces luteireticuli]|uniref:HNH endonuclease n=1 Tax=Streptomyces luteireticuli TaxID=173858 RepID=UPI003555F43E
MSRHHRSPYLNAARRRARKRGLARRDGQHCAYCLTPFADLRQATLDHIVPISLFPTWSSENLVLACRPCNTAKADHLPLFIALLLCAHYRPAAPAPEHPGEHHAEGVHERTDGGEREQPDGPAGEHRRERFGPVGIDWRTLARLAYTARESAVRPASKPHDCAVQLRADLPLRAAHPRTVAARMNACRPTVNSDSRTVNSRLGQEVAS